MKQITKRINHQFAQLQNNIKTKTFTLENFLGKTKYNELMNITNLKIIRKATNKNI